VIPETIRILGSTYTVQVDHDLCHGHGDIGQCWPMRQSITVDPAASPEKQASVIWHECLEAVNNMLELGLEHRVISCLETAINQILVENEPWWQS
jgi:hypothetical protein